MRCDLGYIQSNCILTFNNKSSLTQKNKQFDKIKFYSSPRWMYSIIPKFYMGQFGIFPFQKDQRIIILNFPRTCVQYCQKKKKKGTSSFVNYQAEKFFTNYPSYNLKWNLRSISCFHD